MSAHALSREDVAELANARTTAARVETMAHLVRDLEAGTLSPVERDLAIDILHRFAADAETAVRVAVAWQIHNSTLLTDELAERLAEDVTAVAFPVLRHAQALGGELLLRIVAGGDPGKHLAIAGRRTVPANVAGALVEVGNVVVVMRLLRNPGATLPEPALHRVVDRFGSVRAIGDAVAARPELTLALVERLIAFVSDEIRTRLESVHRLSPQFVAHLVERGREAAFLRALPPLGSLAEAEALARHLHARGRLSGPFLCAALCAGALRLFEAGAAVRGAIPTGNAVRLAWDDGPLGLEALFRKARLPGLLFPPSRIAIRLARAMGYDGGEAGRADFQAEVIVRIVMECGADGTREVDDLLLHVVAQASAAVVDQVMERTGMPLPEPMG